MLISLPTLIQKYDLRIRGVLAIGAHYGEEHNDYVQQNIRNIIYFEPVRQSFEILKNNVQDAILHNIALGETQDVIDMYVEEANSGQSSSCLKPKLHVDQYPHIVFNKMEKVNVDRLDNIAFDRSLYNMINMDVQGYELQVCKGAAETLKTIDYVYTEVNRAELYENCTQINQLEEFLLPYGFKLKEVDWAGDTWGDALFMKDRL